MANQDEADRQNDLIADRLAAKEATERAAAADRLKREQVDEANRNRDNQ